MNPYVLVDLSQAHPKIHRAAQARPLSPVAGSERTADIATLRTTDNGRESRKLCRVAHCCRPRHACTVVSDRRNHTGTSRSSANQPRAARVCALGASTLTVRARSSKGTTGHLLLFVDAAGPASTGKGRLDLQQSASRKMCDFIARFGSYVDLHLRRSAHRC